MVPESQDEGGQILRRPDIGVAEDLEDGKPGGVYTDACLDGPPGGSGERLLGNEGKVLQELIGRPCLTEGVHLCQELPGVPLILCQGIGPGKRLPVNCTEKRPAPLIVTACLHRGIELPVDGTVEFVSENIMVHDLLSVSEDLIILKLLRIADGEKVNRVLPVPEVADKLIASHLTHCLYGRILHIKKFDQFVRIIHCQPHSLRDFTSDRTV